VVHYIGFLFPSPAQDLKSVGRVCSALQVIGVHGLAQLTQLLFTMPFSPRVCSGMMFHRKFVTSLLRKALSHDDWSTLNYWRTLAGIGGDHMPRGSHSTLGTHAVVHAVHACACDSMATTSARA
jgi:hypothetical protein